eukprot:403368538
MFVLLFKEILDSRVAVSASYRRKIDKSKANRILFGVSSALISLFVLLNIVFVIISTVIDDFYEKFFTVYYISWIVLILWFLISLFVLYLRQSGSPYKSEQSKSNLRYVTLVFLLWTGAFILKVVVAIVGKDTIKKSADISMTQAILIIVITLVFDVVPYIPILEIKFIEIFKKSHSKTKGLPIFAANIYPTSPVLITQQNERLIAKINEGDLTQMSFGSDTQSQIGGLAIGNTSQHHSLQTREQRLGTNSQSIMDIMNGNNGQQQHQGSQKKSVDPQDFLLVDQKLLLANIHIKQISFLGEERQIAENKLLLKAKNFQTLQLFNKSWYQTTKDKKHKLGVFYKASLKQEIVLCRVIEFDRMTNYILEDYFNELAIIEQIKMKQYTVPVLGYFIKESQLMIFQPEMVSLFELLYCSKREELKRQLDIKLKYQLSLDIAKILYTFHSFNPPICHGHLTSHNIMIELKPQSNSVRNAKIRIGDLELMPLFKYANTFYDYRSSSVWSAPECLAQPKKQLDPTKEMDIYSYGMLMWELWHETIPFDNDLSLCEQYVVKEDSRPMILTQNNTNSEIESSKTCDEEMAKLIRLCWQCNPDNRPNFKQLCQALQSNQIPQS